MAGPGLLRDRGELEALFDELAAELRRVGDPAEVVMVGGAWLLWHGQRAATRDVDCARRLDAQLAEAIEAVGKRIREAYPHAPEDQHLVDYVRQIAEDASDG